MSYLDELIETDTLLLIDFYSKDCGPCQMLLPELDKVEESLGDAISIQKIDVDQNTALTTEYSIKYQMRGVPTLMLFKRGKLLWKHSGYMNKEAILHHIKQNENNY